MTTLQGWGDHCSGARAEAMVIREQAWQSGGQRRCIEGTLRRLEAMADETWDAPKDTGGIPGYLMVLDEARRNRVVLIDGSRGSGKTSVLLTLLDEFVGRLRDGERGSGGHAPVVPLPLIDLHPMPSNVNLVMALARRLCDVGDNLEQGSLGGEPPRWHAGRDKPLARLNERWQRLVNSAAAWGGGASERRPRVDQEEYAQELNEEAAAGQQIERAFRAYVDALVLALKDERRSKRPPLLVVPIDDADMNPHRAAELLELLRTFYHPRLAFVLTGDSNLFLTALRAHYLGALWQPLRTLPAELRQVGAVGPGAYAVQLATEVYDRVVPPSHRHAIIPTQAGELFEMQLSAAFEGEKRSFAELLKDLHIHHEGPERSLYHLFRPQWDVAVSDGSKAIGLRRLDDAGPCRLRELVQLCSGLSGLVQAGLSRAGEPYDLCERRIKWLWDRAVAEETLYPSAKEELRRVLFVADCIMPDPMPSQAWKEELVVARGEAKAPPEYVSRPVLLMSAGHLRTEPDYREQRMFGLGPLGTTIAIRSPVRTRVRIESAEDPGRTAGAPPDWLSDRVVATLKLATDVIGLRQMSQEAGNRLRIGRTGFVGRSLVPEEFEGPFVRVNYNSAFKPLNLRFVWRLPRWESFLDFELFQHLWERYLPFAETEEALARAFVVLAIAVHARIHPDRLVQKLASHRGAVGSDAGAIAAKSMEELVRIQSTRGSVEPIWQAIGQLSVDTGPDWWHARRRGIFHTWREHVLIAMSAPEAGLPQDVADQIYQGLVSMQLVGLDNEQTEAVSFERRRHLRAVLAASQAQERRAVPLTQVNSLRKELDEGQVTYLFSGWVARTQPPPASVDEDGADPGAL